MMVFSSLQSKRNASIHALLSFNCLIPFIIFYWDEFFCLPQNIVILATTNNAQNYFLEKVIRFFTDEVTFEVDVHAIIVFLVAAFLQIK